MNVNFYGHNSFLLQGKNIVVVTDPWLTDKGAFFGSWFQWPINHHLKSKFISNIDTHIETCLYISHEHQDHFDKDTLKEIQPYINFCILPNFDDKFLLNEMLNLGYKVTELSDQSKYYFNEKDYLELMIADAGVIHDSAAIIHIDNKTFVNQNDCKIFDRLTYIEELDIDFYAVQFSGANWHPVCYQLTDEEKIRISKMKMLSKQTAVRNAIKLIKPKYYIPSAGPAVFPFLDTSLSLGIDNIFVHQPDVVKFLKDLSIEIAFLRPGENLKKSNLTKPIEPPSLAELRAMKSQLSCDFEKVRDDEFDMHNLLDEVNKRIEKIKDIKFQKCPKLIFDWQDQGLEIDLTQRKAKVIDFSSYQMPKSYMKVAGSRAYFSLMSNPNYRWEDIYLSLRATVKREPDVFNTFINIFLCSDPSSIRAGFTTTMDIKDERIVIVNHVDGKNYEINRYCPHNGADLKNANIDNNGNLICPRHSWSFNLKNKGKCESAKASIHAQEIVETISLCETISVRMLKNRE